ncbi:MAG: hypothetical protein LBV79_10510, partial [Candidatus Adiutrix sp.]|nr:hypothetical protein [Candidatus Adiutrix sp.]
ASKAEALGRIARPLLMSALLCAAGFGVLMFSSIPAIRQLAFFSGLAIVAGYFWALAVLPHCPAMDTPRKVAAAPARPVSRGKLRGVWPVFLGLAALAALLVAALPTGLSVRALGLSRADILSDQKSIEETWHLEGGRRVYLTQGETAAEALEAAGQLAGALNEARPGSASSLAGLLLPLEIQRANAEAWRSFIAAEGPAMYGNFNDAARNSGFAAEAFAPFGRWFFADGKLIGPEDLRQAGLGPLVDNFLVDGEKKLAVVVAEANAPEPPPGLAERAVEVSAAALEKNLSGSLAKEKRLLPLCAFTSLAVLLWAFGSAGLAALAFIPALGGLAAVLLTQWLLGRPLGLAEAAALPLVICLGADYGIVVVNELRDNADLGAPQAIFVSGLSTIAGIGILILAEHPVLHALGRTVFIGLAAAMPMAIVLLPKFFSRR